MVRFGPLRVRAMAQSAIAADLGQTLDVKRGLTAEVAFHDVTVVDALTQLGLFFVGQIFDAGVGVDPGRFQDFQCAGSADSVDIGETDFDSLVFRQVNAGYTCHRCFFLSDLIFSLFPPEGSRRPHKLRIVSLPRSVGKARSLRCSSSPNRTRFTGLRFGSQGVFYPKPFLAKDLVLRNCFAVSQPCLCLCLGFSQITITLPLRLMILHFSHMGLTEGLTFISASLKCFFTCFSR